jgi:ribonucleoside-diphosphate reductase alpha chain
VFKIDPAHEKLDIMASRMISDVWRDKYRWKEEQDIHATFGRVARAIYEKDPNEEEMIKAQTAMSLGLWIPGGRIISGAGTEKRVTLMNCYVNEKISDDMEGIIHAVGNVALTLQQGGGIGTDFSTLRPEGAVLTRTHSKASGPLPFMHMWNSTSATIKSAGDRRGAMMGTMCDTHPDLPKFITCKRELGVLTQFNISVLVSDAFMEAIKDDEEWVLYFHIPPMDRDESLVEHDFVDDNDVTQYAYSVWRARDLWKLITENTYEYSEPGVIFIDRINELNNLGYCEDIRCTNPCGEQPLPPHGVCNLGHVNLARCVRNPFTPQASVDYELIRQVTRMGVRFLDNVIDVTRYPLEAQEKEQISKRRLGLGYTGLADLLAQVRVRYGSPDAVRITEEITRTMCWEAYSASVDLAVERGPFPAYDAEEYLSGYSFAATMLPDSIKSKIKASGIRNSLLMTIAPTGTGSILVGNVSSGCEPVFLHSATRRVLKATSDFTDKHETYTEWGYGAKLLHAVDNAPLGSLVIPPYMVTAEDLTIEDHVVMQAAAQRWVDASISKTINVPKETSYDQFAKVYDLAYSLGCKGCTTYRPSDIRGSVLSKPGMENVSTQDRLRDRPEALSGRTYKVKWPSLSSALYLTVNSDEDGKPFEVFIASKDAKYHDWATTTTVMITSIFRKGGDIDFVAKELQQIQSLNDGAFIGGRHHPSLPAYIGFILEKHLTGVQEPSRPFVAEQTWVPENGKHKTGAKCPECHELSLFKQEGCSKCSRCGFTTCG